MKNASPTAPLPLLALLASMPFAVVILTVYAVWPTAPGGLLIYSLGPDPHEIRALMWFLLFCAMFFLTGACIVAAWLLRSRAPWEFVAGLALGPVAFALIASCSLEIRDSGMVGAYYINWVFHKIAMLTFGTWLFSALLAAAWLYSLRRHPAATATPPQPTPLVPVATTPSPSEITATSKPTPMVSTQAQPLLPRPQG